MLDHVLLIDDSDPDLLYGEVVLQRAGCCRKVTALGTALEALDLLGRPEGADVDLILLDINMPEMDGFAFLAAYETSGATRHAGAAVVMLTSSPDPNDKARAATFASVRGYVVKPIDLAFARLLPKMVKGCSAPTT